MRRLSIFFVFVFIFGLTSAIPVIEFGSETFQTGETILARIYTSGEFLEPIEKSDLKFYEGRKEINPEFDLREYDGEYYFYAIINKEGDYTLEIKNILYREAGQVGSNTILKNLSVSKNLIFDEENNKNISQILQIRPGLVFTNNDARINLLNKGDVELKVSYLEEEKNISVGQSLEIVIFPTSTFSYLDILSYKDFRIPIIYFGEISQLNNTSKNDSIGEANLDLKINKENITLNLIKGKKEFSNITLFNFGEGEISEIEISSDLEFIKSEKYENVGNRGSSNISIEILVEEVGNFKGEINLTYTQYDKRGLIILPVNLYVFLNSTNESEIRIEGVSCSSLGGNICETNDICDGQAKFAGTEFCCIGRCVASEVKKANGDGSKWALGLLILILVGLMGYYFYYKYKGAGAKSSSDVFKDKSEEYNKRISGGISRT